MAARPQDGELPIGQREGRSPPPQGQFRLSGADPPGHDTRQVVHVPARHRLAAGPEVRQGLLRPPDGEQVAAPGVAVVQAGRRPVGLLRYGEREVARGVVVPAEGGPDRDHGRQRISHRDPPALRTDPGERRPGGLLGRPQVTLTQRGLGPQRREQRVPGRAAVGVGARRDRLAPVGRAVRPVRVHQHGERGGERLHRGAAQPAVAQDPLRLEDGLLQGQPGQHAAENVESVLRGGFGGRTGSGSGGGSGGGRSLREQRTEPVAQPGAQLTQTLRLTPGRELRLEALQRGDPLRHPTVPEEVTDGLQLAPHCRLGRLGDGAGEPRHAVDLDGSGVRWERRAESQRAQAAQPLVGGRPGGRALQDPWGLRELLRLRSPLRREDRPGRHRLCRHRLRQLRPVVRLVGIAVAEHLPQDVPQAGARVGGQRRREGGRRRGGPGRPQVALGRAQLLGHPRGRCAARAEQLSRPPVQGRQLLRRHRGQQVAAAGRVAEVTVVEQPGRVQKVGRAGERLRCEQEEFREELLLRRAAEDGHAPGAAQRQRVHPVQAVHQSAPVALPHHQPPPGALRLLVLQQCLHEQGVAAGQRVRLGCQPQGRVRAEPLPQRVGHQSGREQAEPYPFVVWLPGQFDLEERVRRRHRLARAEHGQHPRTPGTADEVEQELQRLHVGVLPVVHRQQQRRALGQLQDDGAELVQRPRGEPGTTVAGRGVGILPQEARHLGVGGVTEARALEQLADDPEREVLLQRRAGGGQHPDTELGRGVREHVQQFGAARSHRAGEGDDAAPALQAAVQRVAEQSELDLAAGGFGSMDETRGKRGGREHPLSWSRAHDRAAPHCATRRTRGRKREASAVAEQEPRRTDRTATPRGSPVERPQRQSELALRTRSTSNLATSLSRTALLPCTRCMALSIPRHPVSGASVLAT